MTKLIIDDLRILNIPGQVVYARDLDSAIANLYEGKGWEAIYIDHDLGYFDGEKQDIWPAVIYFEERMRENPIKVDEIFIITSNPVGAQRLKMAFDHMGYSTTVMDPKPILAGVLPW